MWVRRFKLSSLGLATGTFTYWAVLSLAWWSMLVTRVLGRLRQKNPEFKATLGSFGR